MKLKNFLKWLIKAVVACVIAFAVVSGGCVLYYNIPVHFANETGATDYKWEKSKFYSRGIEGFAFGRTDSDGFNNKEDLNGRTVDILFMGSSHGEGFNVSQNDICTEKLNDLLGGEMSVYNIATSGHSLPYLCKDLDAALAHYKPSKYVVFECQAVDPPRKDMFAAFNGTLPTLESKSGGFIGVLQKVPYFRLIYLQLSNVDAAKKQSTAKQKSLTKMPDSEYCGAIKELVWKIRTDCEKHDVKPIILYHPHFTVEGADKITMLHNKNFVELFKDTCDENGITFVSMENDFIKAYNEERKLPYGFSNTAIGEGHLNSFGHELLARKLYETIEDMEEKK